MKKTKKEQKLLTEVELELMQILWRLGEGTVADVMTELPKGRDLAYTSVSTILRILEQKDVLKTRKEGRGHTYIPNIQKQEYEVRAVKDVVQRVFEGTPVALVKQLLEAVDVTSSDLQEIKHLIESAGSRR